MAPPTSPPPALPKQPSLETQQYIRDMTSSPSTGNPMVTRSQKKLLSSVFQTGGFSRRRVYRKSVRKTVRKTVRKKSVKRRAGQRKSRRSVRRAPLRR